MVQWPDGAVIQINPLRSYPNNNGRKHHESIHDPSAALTVAAMAQYSKPPTMDDIQEQKTKHDVGTHEHSVGWVQMQRRARDKRREKHTKHKSSKDECGFTQM